MHMKKILTWFNSIDRMIFGDDLELNEYFSTLSILFAALCGAVWGGSDFLDASVDGFGACAFIITLAALNVGESIMASSQAGIVIGRSFIVILAVTLATAAGYILSVVALAILALTAALFVLSIALKLMFGASLFGSGGSPSGSGSHSTQHVNTLDEDGNSVRLSKDSGEDLWRDEAGCLYEKTGSHTFRSLNDGSELR